MIAFIGKEWKNGTNPAEAHRYPSAMSETCTVEMEAGETPG